MKALEADGATGSLVARGVRGEAREAARRVGHGAGRRHHVEDDRGARRRCSSRATRSSTAATRTTSRTSGTPPSSREKGIHHVDVGTSGGVWGFERGFCLMIGGEHEVVDRLAPIFASIAPGRRRGTAHARATRASRARPSTAIYHCGAERRRPLREDGAQRHRVRAHGRVRRRPEHHRERQRRQRRARDGRRDRPTRASRALPVRHRHQRGRRGLASRQRRRLLAARPHGRRRSTSRPRSRSSPGGSPTRAKAGGRRSRRSTRASPPRC